ncbi:MAG: response regulator, partial [Betaproteobacteria bacterium]|nr:response regulator [Betaproteobacteria bacterium]
MQRSEKPKSPKILIVDGSRVVRASLVRCVNKSHDVCEAHDSGSAWQSVVLDTSIIAVISGLGVASEDGLDLIERIRTNRLARINSLPFYLLASDNLSDNECERAKRLGVTAFIPKKAPAATLAELFSPPDTVGKETDVGRDSTVGLGDLRARIERLDSLGASTPAKSVGADQEIGQRPSDGRLKRCLGQHLKKDTDGRPTACALIFGVDDYALLCERFGQRIA